MKCRWKDPCLFIWIAALSLFLNSCKKDQADIEGVTGYTWKVFRVQHINDSFINPIPVDWELKLKSDHTFSLLMGNAQCGGKYSWISSDPHNHQVTFTIQKWNLPATQELSEKLKTILQSVTACTLSESPFFGVYPLPPFSVSKVLQFQGSMGSFGVYR